MLIPIFLWSLLNLKDKNSLFFFVLSSITYALLILSHFIVALGLSLFIPLLFFTKHGIKYALSIISALVLGLGISAFFWLPAIYEQQYTIYSHNSYTQAYLTNFLNPLQLANLQFVEWPIKLPVLGIHLFIGVLISICLFLIKKIKVFSDIFIFFTSIFIVSLFLISPASKDVWESMPYMTFMQHPWRYLTLTTVSAIVLIVLTMMQEKNIFIKFGVLFLFLIPMLIMYSSYFRPEKYNFLGEYFAEDKCSTTSWAQEYMPKWVETCIPKFTCFPFIRNDVNIMVADMQEDSKRRNIRFTTDGAGGKVIISKYFFPGWQGMIDNEPVTLKPHGTEGLIQIEVPSGRHEVYIFLTDTPIQKFANTVSLYSSFVILFFFLIFGRKVFARL